MTDVQFYEYVIKAFYILGHSISLFLGLIFGLLYWKELFK